MKNLLIITFMLLFKAVSAFSQTQAENNGPSPDDAFMTYNHYPKFTLGLDKTEMLARYPELKEMKKEGFLMHRKFSFYSPSFPLKNNKVYGFSGYLYVSNQLSREDNPTKTKLICEKHAQAFTEMFKFEPKVEEKTDNSTNMPVTTTTYTWEKRTKRFTLMEMSSFDKNRIYYGMISIRSIDENLAQ